MELYRFFPPWANFDGIHYLDIANRGYITEGGFFPLYPLLIHALGGSVFAALAISVVSLVGSVYLLRRLFGPKIVIALLIFPTSFFFIMAYSESFFLFLLLLSFYFASQKRFWLAAIFSLLLSATRLVGVLVLPALAYEAWKSKKFAWQLGLAPLGILGFGWYCLTKWGDFFYFLHAQGRLGNSRSVDSIVLFPQTLWRYAKILTTLSWTQHEWQVALLELGAFFFGAILLYLGWRQKIRLSYQIFAWLAFLLPVSSGTFTALPRYLLIIFPLFLVLAQIKSRLVFWSYLVVSGILLVVLFIWFYQGYFVA